MPRANLFEIETVVEDPANLNSADAEYVVTASDSMDYVVKTQQKHPWVPASEWICHRLAEACGIPTPQFGIIRMRSGVTGFGSQWDGSNVTDQRVINSVLTAIPGQLTLARIFTSIYVLDLFVHNEDRHINNYLFVRTRNSIGVKVYDFSRALLYHGRFPLPALPMQPRTYTVTYGRALRVAYPIVRETVRQTVRRILGVTTASLEQWIGEVPDQWVRESLRRDMLRWWDTESAKRAVVIERGIADGSFL